MTDQEFGACSAAAQPPLAPEHRQSLAFRADTDVATVARLAMDADASVRATVASRRDLGTAQLEHLAADPTVEVRSRIAAHPAITRPAASRLAGDPSADVRFALVANSAVPVACLERLAVDAVPYIRDAASALLPGASATALMQALHYGWWDVVERAFAAHTPATGWPVGDYGAFLVDGMPEVRLAALAALGRATTVDRPAATN